MFDKLKKVFGFGAPDEHDSLIKDDPSIESSYASPFGPTAVAHPDRNMGIEDTSGEIFTQVTAYFNNALPGFLRDSLDVEKEKKLLYDMLTQDVKNHLVNLENQVWAQVESSWRDEREKLQADLKSLSQTAKDIEAKRAEMKTQQLSSDRQKRAMTERIRDLDNQIHELEARCEQLELENKSMINKVKVAHVLEKDCESLREQLTALQSKPAGETGAENHDKELLEEIELLKSENARLTETEKKYGALVGKMSEVEEHLSKIEQVTQTKDDKIKSLKEKLATAEAALMNKSEMLDNANRSIELLKKERDEALLKQNESESVNSQNSKNYVAEPALTGVMSEDDDILNDTDWTVQPSAPKSRPTPQRLEKKQKKNNVREDGQMSLW